MKILVINPGSTSTKIAVYHDDKQVFLHNFAHTPQELAPYANAVDQRPFRKQLIIDKLNQEGIDLRFDAVIGRGSLAKPVSGGVYAVNKKMVDDALNAEFQHACDLACVIAFDIASLTPGCQCFTADPGVVDELCDYARITGSPLLPRRCVWHALNQRAIARRYAQEHNTTYEQLNLIICHMGGGISIAAHEKGRAIDANNALNGDGPFSPERAGTLPAGDLVKLCFSGKHTQQELLKRIAGSAGVSAHLGTNDMREVERRIAEGDEHAKLILDAMIYHVAKGIAGLGAVLCGKVDAILLTGGIAHSSYVVDALSRRISFLAPIHCYPGEDEMLALALNALDVLQGKRTAKQYA